MRLIIPLLLAIMLVGCGKSCNHQKLIRIDTIIMPVMVGKVILLEPMQIPVYECEDNK